MQTDNNKFRKKVPTDIKYILRKMSLKIHNSKLRDSCKVAFYVLFIIKCETFEVKRSRRSFWNKQK